MPDADATLDSADYTIGDARELFEIAMDAGRHLRVHPNGFIQLDLEPVKGEWEKLVGHSGAALRMHVWNPPGFPLPHQETVNEVHDHVFDMRSNVVRGVLLQRLYWFVVGAEGPDTHELYSAVYDQKSSSRLAPSGVCGQLKAMRSFGIGVGQVYTQPAFTLHDTDDRGECIVTIMEKTEVHEGNPVVVCPFGESPDNDFDRATAASQSYLHDAVLAALA